MKIGTRVRVRCDLIEGVRYGNIICTSDHLSYTGWFGTIVQIDGAVIENYVVSSILPSTHTLLFSEEMLIDLDNEIAQEEYARMNSEDSIFISPDACEVLVESKKKRFIRKFEQENRELLQGLRQVMLAHIENGSDCMFIGISEDNSYVLEDKHLLEELSRYLIARNYRLYVGTTLGSCSWMRLDFCRVKEDSLEDRICNLVAERFDLDS